MSEITSHHLHNVCTPRGAPVRDALAWSDQIDEAMQMLERRVEGRDAVRVGLVHG